MEYVVGPEWDRRLVTIDKPAGKIGILMSGGLDSWVLYNLVKKFDPIIFFIYHTESSERPDTVEKLTGIKPVVFESKENIDLRIVSGIKYVWNNHNINNLYFAINQPPPPQHFPHLAVDAPHRPWKLEDKRLISPFLHLYKYHIIDLGMQLNLNLDKTLSCLTRLDAHCGKCWQCMERQWGYDQLKNEKN